MTTCRPITIEECEQILTLIRAGFKYQDENDRRRYFQPNPQIALALALEASLGIRIGDVLELEARNFKGNKLITQEKKTGKVQYRDINTEVSEYVKDYALENGIKPGEKLFNVKVRNVQKQLERITKYLQLDFVSTHSFRKLFANEAYKDSGYNLEVVKRLLKHTSIATTERYIETMQEQVNATSAKMCFLPEEEIKSEKLVFEE